MSVTTSAMPRSPDQLTVCDRSQFEPGWWKPRIQPTAISVGTNASRKTDGEKRGLPHFVQPPTSW